MRSRYRLTHTRPNTLSILFQTYVWRLVASAVPILINTSLQRGACGVSRRPTALAVSLAQEKKPLKRLATLALAFHTPLKQGVNDNSE